MKRIDFNQKTFLGFQENEDILIDTGVLLAYGNIYDAWHNTTKHMFDTFILDNDNELYLYVTPTTINEVTHIADTKPLQNYLHKKQPKQFSNIEINTVSKNIIETVIHLIENDVLLILDSTKEIVLQQIQLSNSLGSADAVNIAIANGYGISFLTLDNKLVKNIANNAPLLTEINNLYFTTPVHRSY